MFFKFNPMLKTSYRKHARLRVLFKFEGTKMSDVISKAVEALNEKMGDDGFDGSIKVDIEGEGCIMIDENGARAGDEDADCTLTADAETFEGMLTGDVNPTSAFMTGGLKVDGDMSAAMKLGAVLS
jgi:putative sterol carrier protein